MFSCYIEPVPCLITIHQSNVKRFRCYDTSGPFIELFNCFFCKSHNNTFQLTQALLIEQVAALPAFLDLILLPRTIITPEFVELVRIFNKWD